MNFILTAIMTASLMITSPASADTRDWRPCTTEDGSGMKRCIWDHLHMGDGNGEHSTKIIKGGTDDARYIPITHRRARYLMGAWHRVE